MHFHISVDLGFLVTEMIAIEEYSNFLKYQEGIWYSLEEKIISYPSDGNNICYNIEGQSFWFRNRNNIIFEAIKKYSIDGPIIRYRGRKWICSKLP